MPLFSASYPQHVYDQFSDIPPAIVNSLTFIEDHDLLDPQNPRRDPAVAWHRFMLATAGRVAGLLNHHWQRGGASTLATQIVKFSDSPGGRTDDIGEKLRQMVTAAAAAYQNGPDTMAARRADCGDLSQFHTACLEPGLWRGHRPSGGIMGLVRHGPRRGERRC